MHRNNVHAFISTYQQRPETGGLGIRNQELQEPRIITKTRQKEVVVMMSTEPYGDLP